MIPNRIDVASPSDVTAGTFAPGPAVETSEGEYQGQKVAHLPDPLSEIADSAEEVGFAASEKIEKSLTERKAHGGEAGGRAHATTELIDHYIKSVPDIGSPRQLREFLDNLKQEAGDKSPDGLIRKARQFFKDPSHQFAALEFAKKALEAEGGHEELAAAVGAAAEKLMAEHGPQVRAGLNIAAQAVAHAESGLAGSSAQELRDLYRDAVLGFEDVGKAYENIIQKFGAERFPQALDFLLQAAGNDLHSGGPSLAPERLRTVVDDLFQVQVLGNSHRAFSELLKKSGAGTTADGRALMGDVLGLAMNRYPRADQITALAGKVGLPGGTEPTIYFLTGLKEQIRLLPLKIYAAPENRDALLVAAQGALDKAIEQEEASAV